MKKILIVVVILIIGMGTYYVFSRTEKKDVRCEDGFRFVPSTQTCESIESPKEKSIDFSKAIIIIPDTNTKISLEQDGESTRYSGKNQDPENASVVQFISLDAKDLVQYSSGLVLVPFIFETGGTGQFIYVGVFDVNTNTLLSSEYIGDRIAISSISVVNEKIKVNFKTRLDSESFVVQPSIPSQIVFEIQDNQLVEIMKLQNADYNDIEIKSPQAGIPVTNKLSVKGSIPGSWYFEANAQYKIIDNQYKEIAVGSIQALADWMTTQRVPFELDISVDSLGYKGDATIIIQSENVQGGEEGEKLVKKMYIPVEFE